MGYESGVYELWSEHTKPSDGFLWRKFSLAMFSDEIKWMMVQIEQVKPVHIRIISHDHERPSISLLSQRSRRIDAVW
jgi:hypothetical protein